jgi:NAD(P)-dependent dehydrogenase (short-subunit alcohol dehydrogenase family)
MNTEVVVVIGVGGIGQAIARRQGPGKSVVLADFNEATLASAAKELDTLGYRVTARRVDVSERDSVHSLAKAATDLGRVTQVVDTAGLSPVQASAKAVLAVELYGVAVFLEEFGQVIASGGAGIVISSMAGYMPPPLPADHDHALAFTPVDQLLQLPFLSSEAVPNSCVGYGFVEARESSSRAGRESDVGRARRTGELHQSRHHRHAHGAAGDGGSWRRRISQNDRDVRDAPNGNPR